VRLQVALVDSRESLGGRVLLAEQLDDADACDPLLEERIDPGKPRTDVPVRIADLAAEQNRRDEHERKDGKRNQGEPPVEQQHGRDDRTDREDVAEDRHDARREHLVQHFDVARDPGHQAPHRVSVEEREFQSLQAREYLSPEVQHHMLADPGREQCPCVLESGRCSE
jgi:hypothetical protein